MNLAKHTWKRFLFGGAVLLALLLPCAAALKSSVRGAENSPALSPAAAEIVRLFDAKVAPEVIKAYIKNSQQAYNLSAEEVIAMKDRGIPNELIAALLQRGAEVRAQTVVPSQAPASVSPAYASAPYAPSYSDYGDSYGVPYDFSGYPSSYYPYGYPYNYWWYNYSYPGGWYYSPFYFGFYGRHRFGFDHRGFDHRGFGFDHRGGFTVHGSRPGTSFGHSPGFARGGLGRPGFTAHVGGGGGFRGGFGGHVGGGGFHGGFGGHGGGGFGGGHGGHR